jgi:hypothetical protein
MLTFTSQITRHSLSTGYRCNQRTVSSLVLFLAAYSSGVQAQIPAEVPFIHSPNAGGYAQCSPPVSCGFADCTGAAGTGFDSGVYSPASTVWAAHLVAISAATERTPPYSASLSVGGLNPFAILPFGTVTHTTPGISFSQHIRGFVSASQVQIAGANVVTSFISSIGALDPNVAQNSAVTPTPQVEAAATSPALSSFSCSSGSITGSGSDSCTVKLTKPAAKGGQRVTLASNNAAVTVPHTVTVPANATSTQLTATVSSVTSEHKVTMTASAGGVSKNFTLQLNAAVPKLTIEPTSLSFGNVTMDTASTLPVTLASTGTAPVKVNSGTLTGTGFTMSGVTFPVTLYPGLAVKVEVRFVPIVTKSATGQLTIQSSSSTNPKVVVALSGTGENVQHEVTLSWKAPSSSASPRVAGYNIYRLTAGNSAYQLLNSSVDTQETYVDQTVQAGVTYGYIVESVDSVGVESAPSNEAVATIP